MRSSRISRRGFMAGASTMVLGATLGACQGTRRSEGGGGKRLATFRCDVTPRLGTPIYSSYKPLETVEFPLLARGVIIEDGGQRYVLCAVDWCELCNSTHTLFRRRLADAVGTDIARVAVQTVHQHTAPIADGDACRLLAELKNPPPFPPVAVYEAAAQAVGKAAAQALRDFEPFDRIGLGQARVERVASNRRVPIGDGKVAFRASSCRDPKLVEAPEGLIDPFLKTVTFSQGDRPLVRMHYYATHPQSFYGDPRASSDFPGMALMAMQAIDLLHHGDVFQMYFTGCAGNVAAGKYNDGSPEARDGLCDRLVKGMAASVSATTYEPAGELRWTTTPLLLKSRQDAGFTEAECRAEMADEKKGPVARNGAASTLAWQRRAQEPIELSALHINKLSILHFPGEPAVEFQLYAQESAPDRFVAVAGYGDCGPGYICLERFFAEGGYEPTASNTVPESEGVFRAAIGALLAG